MLSLIYPPTCVLCGARGSNSMDLCQACRAELPDNRASCSRCAEPLPDAIGRDTLCGACQRDPPPYHRCRTAFRYQYPLPHLIAEAKFRSRFNVIRVLGQCLAATLVDAEVGARGSVRLIPVPLHPNRLRERGYNQSLELARVLARELPLTIDTRSSIRARPTRPQIELTLKERADNVKDAFQVVQPIDDEPIVILDDVVTTGSTVSALARVLLAAGARSVEVWAVARA